MKANNNGRTYTGRTGAIMIIAVILFASVTASMSILFNRVIPYTQAKFVNIMSLLDESGTAVDPGATDSNPGETALNPYNSTQAGETSSSNGQTDSSGGQNTGKHPEFRMEAEAEIFRFSYDNESGKTTVIGVEGNPDKLIAPGTTNLYQFTLANTGDVALDYTMTMEAYVTGTDLWIPVNVRVWDYKNKYLVGSPDSMVDVMELNDVKESAELGAGRYAIYNLEWEWPFERADDEGDITLNDVYDTMLGNLAVDDDLVLHIVIRTVAEYDEDPDNPDEGLHNPPQTGDDSQLVLFSLLCAGSFVGFCVMIFAFFKSGHKEKQAKEEQAG